MSSPPIHAVIWDFGGVISSSPFDAFRSYELAHGLPADFLRGVNARNPMDNAWAQFERNDIDLATFDGAFADESATLGHRVPAEWGLGFAGTVALLAMVCQMLGDRATWLPAIVAGSAAGTSLRSARRIESVVRSSCCSCESAIAPSARFCSRVFRTRSARVAEATLSSRVPSPASRRARLARSTSRKTLS